MPSISRSASTSSASGRRFVVLLAVLLTLFVQGHPGASAAPVSSAGMEDLRARLEELVDASGFDVAVAVTDLQTGETIGVNLDTPRLTGCTINLLVLIQATMDLQAGPLSLEDVDGMIAETIYYSDAAEARELLLLLGAGSLEDGLARVTDLARGLGLESAVFDHPPAFMDESVALVDNTMTPSDMNRLLSMLWSGQVLDPGWTSYLLRRLADVSPGLDYLIPAGVGEDATVMHKNGFYITDDGLAYVDNDAAIVSAATVDGAYSYVISFFSLVPGAGDAGVGRDASALVWDWFLERYGSIAGSLARGSP